MPALVLNPHPPNAVGDAQRRDPFVQGEAVRAVEVREHQRSGRQEAWWEVGRRHVADVLGWAAWSWYIGILTCKLDEM